MKRKSSDLTEFYIQFLIVVYLLWSFPVLSFGQKEVLVPADGTVSEGEEQPVVALTFDGRAVGNFNTCVTGGTAEKRRACHLFCGWRECRKGGKCTDPT